MIQHSHEIQAASVRLYVNGHLRNTFDFCAAGFSAQVGSAFARALVGKFGHTSVESQRQSWRCLRKFSVFLTSKGFQGLACLPPDVLMQFRVWLAGSGLNTSTAQSVQNTVVATLRWCSNNVPEVVSPGTTFLVPGFTRDAPAVRALLTPDDLKAILAACYADIEAAEEQLASGARALNKCPTNDEEGELTELVSQLLDLGGGELPHLKAIHKSRQRLGHRVLKLGGTTALLRRLWLSTESLFPFYLAILTQTSGNPYAVLEMSRECVMSHPLRNDLERIVWLKRRSHGEQHAEFPKGKKWSAPELCRRLSALNAGLLEKCPPEERDKLFICKRKGRDVGLMKFQMLHKLLDAFIERHRLPPFDFKDLRRAGAAAHHLATGSVVAAQRRLNHRSVVTTARYTRIEDRSDAHDAVIRKFQGQLMVGALPQGTVATSAALGPNGPHETVFGFSCADPFAGVAPGSAAGKLCLQFQRCATCPGALITLDDPQVVARVLATFSALTEARVRSLKEGWWPRYKDAYEPTRLVIQDELLPVIAPAVRERALALSTPASLLHLE